MTARSVFNPSFRVRLFLLIALIVVPTLVLLFTSARVERARSAGEAMGGALRLARLVGHDYERWIDATRSVLLGMSVLPMVQEATPLCGPVLARLAQQYPYISDFVLTSRQGDVTCSGRSYPDGFNFSDRVWFRTVMETGGVSLGEYELDAAGQPSFVVATPVRDQRSEVTGVLSAVLDLTWLAPMAARAGLPAGSVVSLIDREGTILIRHPDPDGRVGQPLPEGRLIQSIIAHQEGTVEAPGVDGEVRLFGFARLAGSYGTDMYVYVGIPRDTVLAEVDQAFLRQLIVMGLIAVLAGAAAWYGGDAVIVKPISRLVTAARRLREGDVTVRTGPAAGAGEMDELARAFDRMAAAIEQRETETRQAVHTLRLQATALDAAANAVVITDHRGTITWVNPAFTHLTGYEPSEVVGENPRVLKSGQHGPTLYRALWDTILSGRVWRGEMVNRRKDGTLYVVEQTITPVRSEAGSITHFVGIAQDVTARREAERQVRRQHRMLLALREIDLAISGSLDLRTTFNVLLDQVSAYLAVDAASVFLLDAHTQILTLSASRGFLQPLGNRIRLRVGQGCVGRAALQRETCSAPRDAAAEESAFQAVLRREGFEAQHAVPLVSKGDVRGVLVVLHRTPTQLDAERMEFLEAVALQAALAIENAGLFSSLRRSHADLMLAYDTTLEGWSRALDLRDRETEGHTQRVAELTERLARALGIADDEIVHIRRGALLHDIGKMGIADDILRKTGPLTPQELATMRRHPQVAYELLSPIPYLRPALHIPYAHHERWDGTGYPRGLKGDQIPLAARIFAVVDVWDALRSDRPYRPAWSEDAALAYIKQESGRVFDPHIVEAFLKLVSEDAAQD